MFSILNSNLEEIVKQFLCSLYSHMEMLRFQIHQSAFPLGFLWIDILFFQFDYIVIRNAFSATRKFRTAALS